MTISPHAVVHPEATLGADVVIGPFSVVGPGVLVGEGSRVGSHCVLGERGPGGQLPLHIAAGATIRSHAVVYGGSTFGSRLETGHHTTLREGLVVGDNLRVGSYADLQGDAAIGDHVRIHSNVFVAKGSILEDLVWLFPHVVLTNDPHPPSDVEAGPTVGRAAAVGAGSLVLPGVRIGAGALVAAGAVVARDVPDGMLAVGVPAKATRRASDLMHQTLGSAAYPWQRHFHRGYPDSVVREWAAEHGRRP